MLTLLGGAGLYTALAYGLFLRGIWLDTAAPLLAMALIFVGILSLRYFTALDDLRRMQQELVHSARMATIGQVSSGMAHEFRNILHAIRLHVEGCARPGISAERLRRYMGVIFKIMGNADLILNGILSFARKRESDKTPGNLKQTVENTLLLLKRELLYRKIRVKADLHEVTGIFFDAGQISQVVMNLVNNARDALKGQEEKLIVIRLREDEQKVYLDIGDNGPGIAPEIMKKLFQPFMTTKPEGQGTGLGLSVCHGIVKNHGGDITVASVPKQGTVWHLWFPKSKAHVPAERRAGP